ncbi:hypothetical protein AG1IA_10477 [Rhizoctonia solani AG-1 IA]|uniref:Uncharacterized protein n=1 Tax=Thanatephorus cucumeris (strain AG1-IA) TaxID=983506 RepID=L8WFD2_THACA|nr:hypothetical protein AG1IA_10477 [Rhizoctonia solani AG-1 IA]
MFPAYVHFFIFRRGSFLSWVAIELGICGVLWVLWLGMHISMHYDNVFEYLS